MTQSCGMLLREIFEFPFEHSPHQIPLKTRNFGVLKLRDHLLDSSIGTKSNHWIGVFSPGYRTKLLIVTIRRGSLCLN